MANSYICAVQTITNREARYRQMLPQLQALIESENDVIANTANICAVIKENLGFLWVGFYFVKGDQLVLGPFQGPVACTRISFGKGVCGTSWKNKTSIIVPDVNEFPGHIACNGSSKSELVVPVFNAQGDVVMVLDIDSIYLADFSEIDRDFFEEVARLLGSNLY